MPAFLVTSVVSDSFATPWAVVHQAPLSIRLSQARILGWVAMSSSKGSSSPRDRTHVFCLLHCRWILYPLRQLHTVILFKMRGSQPRSGQGSESQAEDWACIRAPKKNGFTPSTIRQSILTPDIFHVLLNSRHVSSIITDKFLFWDYKGILVKVIVKVKVTQSCPTLCDPMDYTVHGILQARILEWVAFPFSRGSSQPRDRTQVSCTASGFFISWATTEAQEYWGG